MMWNETLQCGWLMWIAEGEHGLMLMLPSGHKPDMTGCIKMATALMPEVQMVQVYDRADEKSLVVAYLLTDGKWEARNLPRGVL